MAEDKKNAQRLGAHLAFADESGFLLIPTVRKTWAPRGQTPVICHSARRDKISVISAVSISPKRKHLGLYFALHAVNIGHSEVEAFVRELLVHLRGHIILLWDNANIHKGKVVARLRAQHRRLHIEMLPPYAPELNPDEGVWSLAKRDLANGRPDSIEDLAVPLLDSLEAIRASRSRLQGCLSNSELNFAC